MFKNFKLVSIVSFMFISYLFLVQSLQLIVPLIVWVFMFTYAMMYDIHVQILKDNNKKYD
jgi:hypothetical protein